MTMATTVVRYIASFSCASLSPAATLQRGLTADLRRRFISSSGNDDEATAKVDVKNRLIDAGNFVNKAGLKPAEVDVGNGPRADVMVSPSTGILKQTTITNEGSRLIYRDMQATTPTDPHVLDAMLPVYTGLYGDPYSRSQDIEYTGTSKPFFSLNSICSSAVRGGSYIYKHHYNKQPKQFTRTLGTMGRNKVDKERSKHMATTDDSTAGIPEANLTEVPKRSNRKWTTSYSNMTIPEAENRLKLRLDLPCIPVKQMLEGKSTLLTPDMMLRVKRKIYEGLVNYLKVGGYPTEANPDFKEANINDIVVLTIYPLLSLFKDEAMQDLRLSREKEITSKDSSTGGMEEFVVMNLISYNKMKYVLIVEAKKVSLGNARKQCFLAMKDMWDYNGGGTVYGFVTMGDDWRMISYDGKFQMSERVGLLFETMGQNEKRWMADYSILVECLNVALSNGGKGPVEVV